MGIKLISMFRVHKGFLLGICLLLTSCGSLESGKGRKGNSYFSRNLRLVWPVDSVKLTQPFVSSSRRSHRGVDLGGGRGTPIKATHRGFVVYTGRKYRGYGKMVLIEFNEEWASLYAHLDSISVKKGEVVNAGDVIGGMGDSGKTTGVHLHFELIKNKQPVNPLDYLPR